MPVPPEATKKYPWAHGKLKPGGRAVSVPARGIRARRRVANAARMWCRRNYPDGDYTIVTRRDGDDLKVWLREAR